jgi:hypothetical protein
MSNTWTWKSRRFMTFDEVEAFLNDLEKIGESDRDAKVVFLGGAYRVFYFGD